MPNLNYRGTQDGTQDFDTLIMNMIEENNKISAKIMAEKLGVSRTPIREAIRKLDLADIGKLNSFLERSDFI